MTDFEAIYAKYGRDIYRFAFYLCGNAAEADDIASETFARAWNAGSEIPAPTAKQYLFTIVRNCYLEGLRREVRTGPLDDTIRDRTAGPYTAVEGRMELDRVLAELQQMPEIDRTALLLHVQEGLSYQEIAAAVGLSLPAVKVKIHRARLKLAHWRSSQEIKQ